MRLARETLMLKLSDTTGGWLFYAASSAENRMPRALRIPWLGRLQPLFGLSLGQPSPHPLLWLQYPSSLSFCPTLLSRPHSPHPVPSLECKTPEGQHQLSLQLPTQAQHSLPREWEKSHETLSLLGVMPVTTTIY